MPILVLADDITGAAEMAGLARSMGCRVGFTTSVEQLPTDADVTVIATDTRSMARAAAVQLTRELVAQLRGRQPFTLFKKCDSALRGHLVAEAEELFALGYRRALILAANPSKGRCVEGGIYRINGVPIAETVFGHDPEFPARSSEVAQLLGGGVHCIATDKALPEQGFVVGESRSEEEVAAQIARIDAETLVVGAADAFRALLVRAGFRATPQPAFEGLGTRQTLIVLGSTVRHDLSREPFFQRNRVVRCPMPDAVFDGGSPAAWTAHCLSMIPTAQSLLLHIPQEVRVDGDKAQHLRRAMAETVASLIEQQHPEEVVIEGGATAFAVLTVLGWRDFAVSNEIAPGVVRLHHAASNTHLTFKPGSYAWGSLFA